MRAFYINAISDSTDRISTYYIENVFTCICHLSAYVWCLRMGRIHKPGLDECYQLRRRTDVEWVFQYFFSTHFFRLFFLFGYCSDRERGRRMEAIENFV